MRWSPIRGSNEFNGERGIVVGAGAVTGWATYYEDPVWGGKVSY